ncbi:fluoride efflux transporter FluC [Raineyella fluvialis]|uniref:Fluoride-specific ion channel FluC n=1 Tax=Raineyella fluvialis TaxID=2662261 RepID=A0A5Q2FB24_9ACTN|nr:CrcB family protein [Raineyella fluvialis]QGF23918.1 CrcB family protein [Raineyella fluvialis]
MSGGHTLPAHLRPRLVGLVAAGGVLGTAVRQALSLVVPSVGGFPVAIFLINLTGAFLLGLLLQALALSGPDEGWRRDLRLGVGTGVLGGYTTYSSLAVATGGLLGHGQWVVGLGYGLGSVLVGAFTAGLGIVLAERIMSARRSTSRSVRGGTR